MTILGSQPLLLSGGAKGADLQFGMCAGALGHSVYHFTFAGHRCEAPESERVMLSEEQLVQADPFLEVANRTLHRSVPYGKPWVINLLRRNYYQIRDTQSVYAVASLTDGMVSGGTAWAVQMYLDRSDDQLKTVYVFDQITGRWHTWVLDRFLPMDNPPPEPVGVWTGIGSRELLLNGKTAIRDLLMYLPPLHPDRPI